jgi:hypothetical protein
MKVVVLGEGRCELGRFYLDRSLLECVQNNDLGALEILIQRLGGEVYDESVTILGLPKLPHIKPWHTRHASLVEVIQDPELLRRTLYPCFRPGLKKLSSYAADAAIVTCDAELENVVAAAVNRIHKDMPGPVLQITFKPEFEVLLLEKGAIEFAAGLPHCSIREVPNAEAVAGAGGLKEAFSRCVLRGGYRGRPSPDSAEFKAKVARALSVSFIKGNERGIMDLRERLDSLFQKK